MSAAITVEKLTLANFADYEALTKCQGQGGCYCSFWHQKWPSMDAWHQAQREAPDDNRAMVLQKVKAGFHVGALVYADGRPVAWVAVGALPEFYWTWRRVARLGEAAARETAGILCLAVAADQQGKGWQARILEALKAYGREQGWRTLEGYPFDDVAVAKHGKDLAWPGFATVFERCGFERVDAHWLSQPGFERSIFRVAL
jgi:GNAT superfamily N-acetyltransferase